MIVLTVPHSFPMSEHYKKRNYDLVAKKFADILNFILKSKTNKIITQINSSQNRITDFDDNRFRHETTHQTITTSPLWVELRKTISDYVEKNSYKNIIVLDIHSFPDNAENFDNNDIVILDNKPYQPIVIDLMKDLNKTNITHKLLSANTGMNSIIDVLSLHPLYIPTVLIEINEKHINDEKKLSEIANIISDFIKQYKYKPAFREVYITNSNNQEHILNNTNNHVNISNNSNNHVNNKKRYKYCI